MYVQWLTVMLVLMSGVLTGPSWAEDHQLAGKTVQTDPVIRDQTPVAKQPPIDAEPPASIFNDELRRFKFQLEQELVTPELAQAFAVRYSDRYNPAILGAYADAETNALVVVGPPEAEPAIRKSLVRWIIETQGVKTPSLEVQHRQLQHERKELLQDMAGIEVSQVEAENDPFTIQKLQARLQALEDELSIVERKIQVVNKYLERLHGDQK